MLDRSQMLKGLLEGCILAIISEEETYGYNITARLNTYGFTDLSEGSVYPVLIRLQKKGLVKSELRKSDVGPKRKYFMMTPPGQEYLKQFKVLWQEVSSTVQGIMEGGTHA